MNNKEFITELSTRSGFTQEDTQKLVNNVIDAMTEKFANGDSVSVTNFGIFEIKKRFERVMINPATKQKMLVPPKLVLNFRPVASIKEKLKKGGDNNE